MHARSSFVSFQNGGQTLHPRPSFVAALAVNDGALQMRVVERERVVEHLAQVHPLDLHDSGDAFQHKASLRTGARPTGDLSLGAGPSPAQENTLRFFAMSLPA